MDISIPSSLKENIDKHAVISFDVFDTLLIRKVAEPHDVFRLVEQNLNQVGFARERIEAEELARKLAQGREVTFEEIYSQRNLNRASMKMELDVERSVLCVNPTIKKVWDYCRKTGRRLLIISDMYLPKDFIEVVLRREGYDGWEGLYVSSEMGDTKGEGGLYAKILEIHKVKPSELLHIGDNEWSDAKKPLEYGINSFLYERSLKTLISDDQRIFRQLSEDDSLASHLMVGVINAKFNSLNPVGRFINNVNDLNEVSRRDILPQWPLINDEVSYWSKFGFMFAGPSTTGFVSWITKIAQKHKFKKVLFVGRDGYILTKLFELFCPAIPCQYIYAPRYVRAMCAARNALDSDEASFKDTDFETLVDTFINKGWLSDNWQSVIIDSEAERKKILRTKFDNVREHINEVIKDYCDYLQKSGLSQLSGRIAVVDSCTINFSSQKLLTQFLLKAQIEGLYWVIPQDISTDDSRACPCETFQSERKHQIENWNLMEWVMTAPNPGVFYITKEKVQFNPSHYNESIRNQIYPMMEKGILDFADELQSILGGQTAIANVQSIVRWINLFCKLPRLEDRKYFSVIQHASDAASKKWAPCMQCWEEEISSNNPLLERLVRKVTMGENTRWFFGSIPIARVKNRSWKKRWYVLGIPVLERRVLTDGYQFRLFRLIPILKLQCITR